MDFGSGLSSKKAETSVAAWRSESLEERIAYALIHGNPDYIEADMNEALACYPKALAIIEGPLMAGMNIVGDRFGEGKMFLPQVVKSARVMKKAVAVLEPHMEQSPDVASQGRILMATVKGDVHDIGKNIVGVVLRCNGYDVVDLGVMVPCETILKTAMEQNCDLIGLSGLITPSLHEMVHVAEEMTRQGIDLPLLIGGATTSKKHTAVKIAPAFPASTHHVLDASRAVGVVRQLMDPSDRQVLEQKTCAEHVVLRERYASQQKARKLLTLSDARNNAMSTDWATAELASAPWLGVRPVEGMTVESVRPFIDWGPFFQTWELKASWKKQMADPEVGPQYQALWDDAQAMLDRWVQGEGPQLSGVFGFFAAHCEGDDIVVFPDREGSMELARFPMLRQQETRDSKKSPHYSLADFVAPKDSGRMDSIGVFAVTGGLGLEEWVAPFVDDADDYSVILAKALADRLAEACAEWAHMQMRAAWGFPDADTLSMDDRHHGRFRGIRPAFGYPACPNVADSRQQLLWLGADRVGLSMDEGDQLHPEQSTTALVALHSKARYFSA